MNPALRFLTVIFLLLATVFSAERVSDAKEAPVLPVIVRELHGKSYQTPWNSQLTLKTLIISQGGLNYPGSPPTAEVRRVLIDGTESRMPYDLRKLFIKDASDDPKLQPGDIVTFTVAPALRAERKEKSEPAIHISVTGGVRSPGIYPYTPDLTVKRAIQAAGGYNSGAGTRIYHIRDGKRTEVDYRVITKNPDKDIPLKPGDIVYVGNDDCL